MATAAELITILSGTSLSQDFVHDLVGGLAGMWLLSEPADVLAEDLVQSYPLIAPDEVRVGLRPLGVAGQWRFTAVAPDRPGLLATTAGLLAQRRLSVRSAGATTWHDRGISIEGFTVEDPDQREWDKDGWDRLAGEVRDGLRGGQETLVPWKAQGPVKVVSSDILGDRQLITVEAPDRIGLLWAIASWFHDNRINVEAARLDSDGVRASDTFLVEGSVDGDGLAAHLAGRRRGRFPLLRSGRR